MVCADVVHGGGVFIELFMESIGNVNEAEDEKELEADATHVYVKASFDLIVGKTASRGHGCAGSLDEEGYHVEEDEVESKPPCFDPENSRRGGEVVDHAAKNHVDESVDP